MSAEERQLWERQHGETPKQYAAFSAYRDTPPITRSIKASCKNAFGDDFKESKTRTWQRWSSDNNWVERADAWDYEVDRIGREADLQGIAEMRVNHIKLARGLQSAGAEALKKLIKRLKEGGRPISDSIILQYITQGAMMERTARGEPDSIVQEVGKDGVLELIWQGPPIADQDAATSLGPVDSKAEPSEV